jgi:hypothetical protein
MFSLRKSFRAMKNSSIFDYTQILPYDQLYPLNDPNIFFLKGKSISIATKVYNELDLEVEHNSDNITLFYYTSLFTQLPTKSIIPLVSTPFNTS